MPKAPAISVIMPVYNTPVEYLKKAVNSILEQTFKDFELIIVNDASTHTDVKEYLDTLSKHPQIRLYSHEKNKGVSVARNLAIRHAKGTYIATMDSDDISLPERLCKQYHFMEGNAEVVLCGTHAKEFQGRERTPWRPTTDAEIRKQMLFRNVFFSGSLMIRKAAILKAKITYKKNFGFGEDYIFTSECSRIGKLWNVPEILYFYRVHWRSALRTMLQSKETYFKHGVPMYRCILEDFFGEPVEEKFVRAHALMCMAPGIPRLSESIQLTRWIFFLIFCPKITMPQKMYAIYIFSLVLPRGVLRTARRLLSKVPA